MSKRVLIWANEQQGGIATYARELHQALVRLPSISGPELTYELELSSERGLLHRLSERGQSAIDLLHVQHEYGLFGSKLPGYNRWRSLHQQIRAGGGQALRAIATAHTVLEPDFRYPTSGQGLKAVLQWGLNAVVVPLSRQLWLGGTWGGLDGVITHSALQKRWLEPIKNLRVVEIPHFVYDPVATHSVPRPRDTPVVTVFGYFSFEKGQDLAIEALAQLPKNYRLNLAGSSRRPRDRSYEQTCRARVSELGLESRVQFLGFIPNDRLGELYAESDLILAPFRSTSGSGSLARALAQGAAILASDLPLNLEINDRVPGALATYRALDPSDCALKIQSLMAEPEARVSLSKAARTYAQKYSLSAIAALHRRFYGETLN